MTDEVRQLINKYGFDVDKFSELLTELAIIYDKKYDSYPEHAYEGLSFKLFVLEGVVDYSPIDEEDKWHKLFTKGV